MIVMPSNNSGAVCCELFRRFPGRLAHLQSADSLRVPKFGLNWSLDNGVFGAFTKGKEWDETNFYAWLEAHSSRRPDWVVVPDSVGNAQKTIHMWNEHAPRVRSFGNPVAFVAQDGMTRENIPTINPPDILFVGGTTEWKWKSLPHWCASFPRVHVGRVNTERLLWMAHRAGAESADGTGFFRGDQKQLDGIIRYLEQSTAGQRPQLELSL